MDQLPVVQPAPSRTVRVVASAGNHQSQVRNASARPGVSWQPSAALTTAAPLKKAKIIWKAVVALTN